MKLDNDKITTILGTVSGVAVALEPVFTGASMTPQGLILGVLMALFGFFTNRRP